MATSRAATRSSAPDGVKWRCFLDLFAVRPANPKSITIADYQEFLVGQQNEPGGRFAIDWSRSGAVDYSGFVPSNRSAGGLELTTSLQYACCGKSAFTAAGRRVILHA